MQVKYCHPKSLSKWRTFNFIAHICNWKLISHQRIDKLWRQNNSISKDRAFQRTKSTYTKSQPIQKELLLSLGFVLLLGVGCVAIYPIVMELYNQGNTPYSRQLGLKNSALTAESTSIEISTSPLISEKTVQSIKGDILIVFYRDPYCGKATLNLFFFFLPQNKDCFWDSVKDNKYQKGYHSFCGHHLLLLLILLLWHEIE